MCQEAKNTHPVINRYKNDPFFSQCSAIVNWPPCTSAAKPAAIYPNQNGPFIAFRGFGPNIQVKAILTYWFFGDQKFGRINHKRHWFTLHRAGAISIALFYAYPRYNRL